MSAATVVTVGHCSSSSIEMTELEFDIGHLAALLCTFSISLSRCGSHTVKRYSRIGWTILLCDYLYFGMALPIIDLDLSFATIKRKLKSYLWNHFWVTLMTILTAPSFPLSMFTMSSVQTSNNKLALSVMNVCNVNK